MGLTKPRILIIDIETSPIVSYTWGLFDQNVALNQVKQDWHLLSFAAKFLGEKKVHYQDQSGIKDKTNDQKLLKTLWKLMDEADIVLGQNSIAFDVKRIKARMALHGMRPPSSFRQLDTMRIAKKHFNFTSNKLEYLSKSLCSKHTKLTHKKFPGFELWKECLKDNKQAWKEMKVYNIQDVLSTEELYLKLRPWDNSINVNTFSNDLGLICSCGSKVIAKNGYNWSNNSKRQRYRCSDCGTSITDKTNLLSIDKRQSLKSHV